MTTNRLRGGLAVLVVLALTVASMTVVAGAAQADDEPTVQVYGTSSIPSTVRFYRGTGDETQPWELAKETSTRYGYVNGDGGNYFFVNLLPGTYRATFNEIDDGTVQWDIYKPTDWVDAQSAAATFAVAAGDTSTKISSTTIPTRGGRLVGSFVDNPCDNSLSAPAIQAYAADGSGLTYDGGSYGISANYEAQAFGVPTKFKVTSPYFQDLWVGGDDFESATAYDLAPGAHAGPDIPLTPRLEPGTSREVTGEVLDRETHDGVGGLAVRYYRSESGTAAGPWELAGETTTSDGSKESTGGLQRGKYKLTVPAGVYRATVNETDDGSGISRAYRPNTVDDRYDAPEEPDFADASTICIGPRIPTHSRQTRVTPSGGQITGKVTDPRGNALSGIYVALFADDATGQGSEVVRYVTTDGAGNFTIQSIGGPAKLRFTPPRYQTLNGMIDRYKVEWTGDALDIAQATSITAPDGVTVTLPVTALDDAPVVVHRIPKLSSKPRVGQIISSTSIATSLDPVYSTDDAPVLTYQWLRNTGSTVTPISGATKKYYTPTMRDAASRLSLRVTVVPPADHPGQKRVTVTTALSGVVMAQPKVAISGEALGGRKLKMKATVTIKGVDHPSGKVYLSWVYLKPKGRYLYPTGKVYVKKVSFRNGKVSYTAKMPKKGYWAFGVVYPEARGILRAERSSFKKVK